MEIITNKFKKVADFVCELFKIAGMPLHFSRFSNKIYTNYQKLFLLVYKQFRKFTYEEILTDLADNLTLRVYLGFSKLPHYSTLIKFTKKLSYKILDKLVLAFKKIVPTPQKVAIDATGFGLDNASQHYCKRIGRPYHKRPFMKATFIVDIKTYIILLCKMRKSHRHDTKDAKPLVQKLALHYQPDVLYADRGYDDNNFFKLVYEKLKAYPMILQKNLDVPKHKRTGEYRKMTFDVFDYGEYLQRNKIETGNSMIKRRFGSRAKSRICKTQKVDLILRVIAYNIDRLIRLGNTLILIIIRIRRVSQ